MSEHDDPFEFFWSGPFSQWHDAEFELDGIQFNTAEQAMMYHKAKLFGDDEVARRLLGTRHPRKQKALGRQVKGFDEIKWDTHKEEIVCRVNFAKFSQNENLRRKLFQTGNKALVEASPHDTIWGIGLDEENARKTPPEQWPGQNLLGEILTEVREELRAAYPQEAASAECDGA